MAKNVEVLLRERVQDLGSCGDIVKVSPGFARNFLMPRGLAMQATADNKKAMARRRLVLDAQEKLRAEELAKRLEALAGVELKTSARADEHGHLFGSVNAAMIAELLRNAGHPFEESNVRLDAPLKTVGSHPVRLHVHGAHETTVTVVVEAQTSP